MLISLFPEIVGTFRIAMTMMTSATVIIVIDGKVEKEVLTINKGKLPGRFPSYCVFRLVAFIIKAQIIVKISLGKALKGFELFFREQK